MPLRRFRSDELLTSGRLRLPACVFGSLLRIAPRLNFLVAEIACAPRPGSRTDAPTRELCHGQIWRKFTSPPVQMRVHSTRRSRGQRRNGGMQMSGSVPELSHEKEERPVKYPRLKEGACSSLSSSDYDRLFDFSPGDSDCSESTMDLASRCWIGPDPGQPLLDRPYSR